LADLATRGYVVQKRGSGTYLADRSPENDIDTLQVYGPGSEDPFWCAIMDLLTEEGQPCRRTSDAAGADLAIPNLLYHTSDFQDLSKRVNGDSDVAEAVRTSPVRRGLGLDEEWFGVPIFYRPYLLFCREDLFDAAGVELPEGEMNWEDFLGRGERLTDASAGRHGFGWQAFVTSALPFLWQCDGGLLEPADHGELRSILHRPGSRRGLEAWRHLAEATGYHERAVPLGEAMTARKDFLSGSAAMMIATSNMAQTLGQLGAFPWRAVPIPRLGRPRTGGSAYVACIGKNARSPEKGLQIIETLLSPLWQQRLAGRLAAAPAAFPSGPIVPDSVPGIRRLITEQTRRMCFDYFIPSEESYRMIYGMFLGFWEGMTDLETLIGQFSEYVSVYNRGQALKEVGEAY
jgi:ABC-type glycerol-3-phosphate transport system substrate-binding protein